MRQIQKTTSLPRLDHVLSRAPHKLYGNIRNPLKRELREHLVKEQNYLCAYCCQRIGLDTDTTHVEHLKPQHLDEGNLEGTQTDLKNLVASCTGRNDASNKDPSYKAPLSQRHCGHEKAEWWIENLFVNPTQELANRAFTFSTTGGIEANPNLTPEESKAAHTTISRLNLNSRLLQVLRSAAIDALFEVIRGRVEVDLHRSVESELSSLRDQLGQTNDDDSLKSFQPVLLSVILNQLASLD